ncbi:MAG: hypothetical protein GY772_28685 [bacterium]|nr:hypothetical protein [bacterium]
MKPESRACRRRQAAPPRAANACSPSAEAEAVRRAVDAAEAGDSGAECADKSGLAAAAGADLAADTSGAVEARSVTSPASSTDEEVSAAMAGAPHAATAGDEGKKRMKEMFKAAGCRVRCVSFARTFRQERDIRCRERENACDEVFDCEVFRRDPSRPEGPLQHWQDETAAHKCCGLNGNVVAGLVLDSSFQRWLQDLVRMRMLRVFMDAGQRFHDAPGSPVEVTFGFRCRVHVYIVVRSLSNLCMCFS